MFLFNLSGFMVKIWNLLEIPSTFLFSECGHHMLVVGRPG